MRSVDSVFLKKFGNNLRNIRKKKGMTQEQLANDLGIEISQISRIERGILNTSINNVFNISKVLDVSICDLFSFIEE